MRPLVFGIFFCLSCFGIDAQSVKGDVLVKYGKQFLGTKYKYGKSDPKRGFDCSGFIYYVYSHFKLNVPRSSMAYEKTGREVKIDSCRPGDVIVFTGTKIKDRKPAHVGIIISKPGEKVRFMHCSSGKKANGVTITNYTESDHYQKRFIKVIRLDAVKQ
jgi:cell wall-associated NlpC family hydrolase